MRLGLSQFGRRNLDNYVKGSLSLRLEEYFREKAKENKVKAADLTNLKLGNSTLCQKSDKAIKKIDTKKELAKVSGVSYDTIYKVKEIKSQTPAEILSELARRNINLITRKYLNGRRYKEEKKAIGTNRFTTDEQSKGGGSNFPPIKTAEKIGAQVGMSDRGVKDAEKFAEAVGVILFQK